MRARRGDDHERCGALLDEALEAKCRGLSAEASELVDGWLAANGKALDSLHRASERPTLYVPVDAWADASLDGLGVLEALRLLACRAERRLAGGNPAAAADDLAAQWKLSALLGPEQDPMIAVIGMTVAQLGGQLARDLAGNGDLPPDARQRLLRSLPALDERAWLIAMIGRARIEALLLAQYMVAPHVDLEATLRRVNDGFDLLERAANEPTAAKRSTALKRAGELLEQRAKRKPHPFNAVSCRLPGLRKWCTWDRYVGDLAVSSRSIAIGVATRKLGPKIAEREETRRVLLAATGSEADRSVR